MVVSSDVQTAGTQARGWAGLGGSSGVQGGAMSRNLGSLGASCTSVTVFGFLVPVVSLMKFLIGFSAAKCYLLEFLKLPKLQKSTVLQIA